MAGVDSNHRPTDDGQPSPSRGGAAAVCCQGRQRARRRLISASARSRTASMLFSAVSRICLTARVTSETALLAELFALRPVPLAEFRLRVAAAFFAVALRCDFVCATWEFSSSIRATYYFCPVSAMANADRANGRRMGRGGFEPPTDCWR